MTTDWKQTLKNIALAIGRGLLFLGRHLLVLLSLVGGLIVHRAIPAIWTWLRDTALPTLHALYMRVPRRRTVATCAVGAAAIAIAVLLWRTPGDGSTAPAKPVVLQFFPAEAAPGAPLQLTGASLEAGEPFEVTIGGQPAAAQRLADGSVRALVPLYLGPDNWPVPPDTRQKIEILRDGKIIAASSDGLRVTELQRASGTTASVQRSLEKITDGYERIFESLPVQHENERTHRRAVVAVLRGLVSNGDRSLAAVLAGTSPLLEGEAPDVELMDALLVSSGAADYLEAYGEAMAAKPRATAPARTATTRVGGLLAGTGLGLAGFSLQAAGNPASQPGAWDAPTVGGGLSFVPRCRGQGKDFEIACLMQIQGVLTDFSQAFVKPTAETYANTVGLAISAVSAAGAAAIPAHIIISALLSVTSVVMDKVVPSLFPASLSMFEMEVGKTLIDVDETTKATITIAARNNPQTITFLDLLDIIKSVLGPAVKFPNQYHDSLKNAFEYTLDMYLYVFKATGQTPSFEHGVFTMPAMTWGPTKVTSDDLVSFFSYEPTVVAAQEEELSWRGEDHGQATVRAMPRGAGDRSKVLQDHSMCPGCVWSGGAFGTEMLESSERIVVGLEFDATPLRGHAPLDVRFRWKAIPADDGQPMPCTLDFGDGSPAEHIADCLDTRSFTHTYPYTSRLEGETGGAYVATLSLDRSPIRSTAEVFPDWEFSASPGTGQAPVDARFSWDIPWPRDRKPPACEFDPGDGSERKRFDDCQATTRTEHTFERGGSFAPTLTIIHGGAKDTKTAPVSVAEEGTCDESLLKHKAWQGTVSYSYGRDFWNTSGSEHVVYKMGINVGAEMPEITRKTNRSGDDSLVQYHSPSPQGKASMTYQRDEYHGGGNLARTGSFKGGSIRPYDENLEDRQTGSMLSLTLDAAECAYMFHVQAWVNGVVKEWSKGDGETTESGYMVVGAAHGYGVITSSTSISGSAPFQVVRDLERMPDGTSTVSALDTPLNEGVDPVDLGKATVTWDFRPVD